MPLTATTACTVDTDSSYWVTATSGSVSGATDLGTGGTIWTTARPTTGTATIGSAYFDTTAGTAQIYTGNDWTTIDGNITFDEPLGQGDSVSVSYVTSGDGLCISNPYIHVNREDMIKRRIREIMKSNLLIKLGNTRQKVLGVNVTPEEIKARMTLRDQITEKQWRGYLTNGFVMVKGASGKFYQVFNDQRHIKVYSKGKLTDEICIHSEGCPPSDHIINMMILIQSDENLIWTKGVGNVYNKDGTRRNQGAGLAGVDGNIVVNGDAAIVMQDFIAGGQDVPVEYVGNRQSKLSLIETYKNLKAA